MAGCIRFQRKKKKGFSTVLGSRGSLKSIIATSITSSTTGVLPTTYADIPAEVYYYPSGLTISANMTVGTSTPDNAMVVMKVNGNLTLANGVTLTTTTRKRGLVIYVTGNVNIGSSAKISMTARGANAVGNRIHVDGSYEVAAAGSAGGQLTVFNTGTDAGRNGVAGVNGTTGTVVKSGGGGSGAMWSANALALANCPHGAAGTSYSGGAGGGGFAHTSASAVSAQGGINGGKGGEALDLGYGSGSYTSAGAGNGAQTGAQGPVGTGGLLIVMVVGSFTNYSLLESRGTNAYGAGRAQGGGSGGGPIVLLVKGAKSAGSITTTGGSGGGTSPYGVVGAAGGSGGNINGTLSA